MSERNVGSANRMKWLPLFAVLLLPLRAQDPLAVREDSGSAKDHWSVLLGAQVMAYSAYEGSDRVRVLPLPVFSATYDGRYYLGSSRVGVGFGGGMHVVHTSEFTLDLGLGVGDGRPEKRAAALAGMGDRSASLWTGTGVHWRQDGFHAGLTIAHGLRDDAGNRASLSLGQAIPIAKRWSLGGGVHSSWSDAKNMQYDFGINRDQAARRAALVARGDSRIKSSEVGPYAPGAGMQNLGLSLSLGFTPAADWRLNCTIHGGELQGDARNSPIVRKTSYLSIGSGFALQF